MQHDAVGGYFDEVMEYESEDYQNPRSNNNNNSSKQQVSSNASNKNKARELQARVRTIVHLGLLWFCRLL